MDQELQTYIDQGEIHQILMRYCRAIDRCDELLLASCYHDNATYDYGDNNGLASDFVKNTIPSLRQLAGTQHSVSNYYFLELTNDRAKVESYCYAYHRIATPGSDTDMIVAGRYLDDFSKINAKWRIQHRTYIMDWNQNAPSTAIWDRGMFAGLSNRGDRFPHDITYNGNKND